MRPGRAASAFVYRSGMPLRVNPSLYTISYCDALLRANARVMHDIYESVLREVAALREARKR